MTTMSEQERSARFEAQRQRIRERYLRPADERSASSARGLHHTALVSSDVEQTVRFYQDLLEFPLTELIENRDYPGSSHFFFDIGNDNLLAFFDFPGLDQGPYQEVLGGLHHLAISVERSRWERLRDKLTAVGVEFAEHSGVSLYSRDRLGRCTAARCCSASDRQRENAAHHVERFRCWVVGHTVRPPRDVHIGPHQHAAVFADLACPQSS
jgi:catechol 2,3-dioxygenase-like lactoylglutathione lyase family enzyme